MVEINYTGVADTRAFKDVIGGVVAQIAEQDPNFIYLDADLMSCIGTQKWAGAHAARAINCGISEANMVGVACGLASCGFKPLVHTFGPFASRRVYDQLFLSAAYGQNSITVLGSDPGVTAAFNGGTHMPFEDMALYRAIPEATVIDITDIAMLQDLLPKLIAQPNGLKYLRVGRKTSNTVYADGSTFEIGKGVVLRDGADVTIVACGIMVHEAMQAAQALEQDGIHAAVLDLFTVKPIDVDLIVQYANKTGALVTAENHNKIGGLYSAVCEVTAKHCPVPVAYVAVEDVFGEVGPQDYLQERFGLTAARIVGQVRACLARRNA